MSKVGQNEREFFRISYKGGEQPHFVMGKKRFIVLDISEGGFRFGLPKDFTFYEQETIEGTLGFPGRGFVPVKGIIIRITRDDVAVQLKDPGRIPLAKIMEEQRFLIKKGKL
jgi:hypothetical protein